MHNVFIGRQPIYNRVLDVYAYELLFRAGEVRDAGVTDGDQATSEVLIGTVMDIGLDVIVGGKPAFINLSRGFLTGSVPMPLDRRQVVLEVLEDVPPEPAVIETLRTFARQGYTIALDDFVLRPEVEPLLEFAHIVKLDVLALGSALEDHVRTLRRRNLRLLAEKVETHEQFTACKKLGFDYFQGYFFCRPNIVKGRGIHPNRLVVLRLMARLQDPNVEVNELEAIIAQDVSLTYRLLRYINSAYFGLRTEVDSLRRALILLGTRTIRNWASLILLTRIDDKPRELMTIALMRANMCELLATGVQPADRDQYFTVGLFSVLDALMDRPMDELMHELPLAAAVKEALIQRQGATGKVLQTVLDYEKGEWSRLDEADPSVYRQAYVEALKRAEASAAALRG